MVQGSTAVAGSCNGAASRSEIVMNPEAVMDPETVTEAAAAATVGSLHWADWVVVVIYFILVLAVGLLVSEKRAPSPCVQEKRAGLASLVYAWHIESQRLFDES